MLFLLFNSFTKLHKLVRTFLRVLMGGATVTNCRDRHVSRLKNQFYSFYANWFVWELPEPFGTDLYTTFGTVVCQTHLFQLFYFLDIVLFPGIMFRHQCTKHRDRFLYQRVSFGPKSNDEGMEQCGQVYV